PMNGVCSLCTPEVFLPQRLLGAGFSRTDDNGRLNCAILQVFIRNLRRAKGIVQRDFDSLAAVIGAADSSPAIDSRMGLHPGTRARNARRLPVLNWIRAAG